ncbi:MAG: alanine--tRNA ligase [Ferruginibacter sp.]
MMNSAAIRQTFLDFFKSKQHTIVSSAPIVVKNDPTLLFTNAGMNQFKDYFLGNKSAPSPRIADTQKCLRVSGKHNDLEEVGVDSYHHTMFEMLGNWSFGDPENAGAGYFKAEAIAWSWELLTSVYKIPKEHLYVTVFEGDEKEGLAKDNEAFNEWKKYVSEDQIIFGNKKDNFWEMGDTGPCGPCTEIHADTRSEEEKKAIAGSSLVNNDHPQVIEIWNNVFIQHNRKKDGSLEPLPAKHVDTGMGLERLVRVLQNKQSNYDTDLFSGTIEQTGIITGKKYRAGDDKESIAFRVLADHIRAISFTIADGQLPSNTGAGYVIRRILRRAVRYYYSCLDYKQPLLHQLLPVIAKQFESVFPELIQQQDFVGKVIKEEEEAFLRTLEKGLKKMDEIISHSAGIIEGTAAFELYDTFGFPIDLTKLIASENNIKVDEAGFEKEMQQQKNRSRSATALDTEEWQIVNEGNAVGFVGYDSTEVKTKILRYRKVKGKGKELYQILLEVTPFYAESGGQVGDTGDISLSENGVRLTITDTKKENDLIIHFADKIPSDLSGNVTASINIHRRKLITVHHSVTHLMHAALRKVLGKHVSQKGSLVNEEHTRFDFSHFSKMTDQEITAVEQTVNERIRENIPVVIRSMGKDEAISMGAMALFGEKYGDTVRVVIMDPGYSIELCGGTHVGNTGELGIFKIRHEGAVAAGVRRIEAVCGSVAEQFISENFQQIHLIRDVLKNPKDIAKSIEGLLAENSALGKRIESLEARQLVGIRNELMKKDEIINNISFIGEIIEVSNADALKKLCFDFKHHLHDHMVVLCANIGGKANVAVSISDTVIAAKKLDASKLIREHVSKIINGGGGGQPSLATAGGQDVSRLQEVIDTLKSLL